MTPADDEPPAESDVTERVRRKMRESHAIKVADRPLRWVQVRWILVATAILTSLAVLIFLGYACSTLSGPSE